MTVNTKKNEAGMLGESRLAPLLGLAKKNSMLIALIAVFIIFGIFTQGRLLLPGNITNLISQNGYVVILAVGMLMCILTSGSIDLSVGSLVCLIAGIGAQMIVNLHIDIGLTIATCLIAGILIGAWQGFWIAYIRIPAFIVTLAGMLAWRGLAAIVIGAFTISLPTSFTDIFSSFIPDVFGGKLFGSPFLLFGSSVNVTGALVGVLLSTIYVGFKIFSRMRKIRHNNPVEKLVYLIINCVLISAAILALCISLGMDRGIPVLLILLAAVILVYSYLTQRTVPGRYLYAMGGNEKAAKLSGINTNRVLFLAYVNMGLLCAVAALVCMARFNSSYPQLGLNYELDAIAACFIGGASAYGGIGTVTGAVIGAMFMGVLNMGMSIMGLDQNVQMAVKGFVLLAAVAFDVISKRKSRSL